MSEKIKTQEEHDIEDLEEMMEVIPFSKLELKIIERAIESLEKQVPKKVVRDSAYSPALCPTCHTDEICKNLGDGYYTYFTSIKYCPQCGQLLDWEE